MKMKKILVDAKTGIETVVEMTEEEVAEYEAELAEREENEAEAPPPEPTAEERLAVLEAELLAAKILLGLEEAKE